MNTLNGGVCIGKNSILSQIDSSMTYIGVMSPDKDDKELLYNSILVPSLLTTWNESCLILDYDSRIFNMTAGCRQKRLTNKILKLDINSVAYNPLSEVRLMSYYESDDLRYVFTPMFDYMVCDGKPFSDIMFVLEQAVELLKVAAKHIMYKEFLQNPKFIYEDSSKIPVSDVTLLDVMSFFDGDVKSKIKAILSENLIEYGINDEIKEFVKDNIIHYDTPSRDDVELVNEKGQNPVVIDRLNYFSKSNALDDVIKTIKKAFELATKDIPDLEKSIFNAKSKFRMYDLVNGEKPVSVYLCYNDNDLQNMKPIYKVFMSQFFEKATYIEGMSNKYKCLVALNRLKYFGYIAHFNDVQGYASGFGIKFLLGLNSLDYITDFYGDENKIIPELQSVVYDYTLGYKSKEQLKEIDFDVIDIPDEKPYKIAYLAKSYEPVLVTNNFYYEHIDFNMYHRLSEIRPDIEDITEKGD